MIPKKVRKRSDLCRYPKSVNLYKFIRLILGADISDRNIARRWKMHQKTFSCFKTGKYTVPRLEKLAELAKALGVNRHLVFEVALGASAKKVFRLIRKNDLPACRPDGAGGLSNGAPHNTYFP